MEVNDYLLLIKRKKQTIFSLILIFLIIAIIFSFSDQLKYRAKEKVLVVQNYIGIDPYAFSKSNEYLSNLLSQVVSSNSFFNRVMNSGYSIDKNYFSGDINKKMKIWSKTVEARSLNDSGIIEINVYHPDKYQLEQIAQGIGFILKTQNQYYHGGGESVSIKVIDEPIISKWPVKPNLPLNISLAILFGLVFSLSFIYIFPEKKYDLRVLPKRKNKIVYTSVTDGHKYSESDNYNWHSVGDVLNNRNYAQSSNMISNEIGYEINDSENYHDSPVSYDTNKKIENDTEYINGSMDNLINR